MSPPRSSPSLGSIVRTCAFFTMNSPRAGSSPGDPLAARLELVAALVPQPASAIVPSAVAAPKKPRRLILSLLLIKKPKSKQLPPLFASIVNISCSDKPTNDKHFVEDH